MNQSSRLFVLAVCAVVAILPTAVRANVYPTSLGQSVNGFNPANAEFVTLSYLLNEDATGVDVEILNGSNTVVRTLAGGLTKGVNSVNWDGKDNSNVTLPDGNYSFRVTSTGATRTGHGWTLISPDTALTDFEAPMGLGVNTNANSPYYGRVYIANGRSLTTELGRTMTDALWMLNADLSDTNIAGGTGPHNGNVAWSTVGDATVTNNPASPFRVQVGPDDNVYVTDWSDGHSGLWMAPPDLSSTPENPWIEVLDSTDRASSGLNATHGSISDVVITGTGASRVIYTADEDFVPSGGTTGAILRYDIGETQTFTGAPSGVFYSDAANNVRNFHTSIARNPADGSFWITQRAGETTDTTAWPADVPGLIKLDSSGNVVWRSVPNLQATSQADNFRGARGVAIDPVNNVMAVIIGHSNVAGNTGGGGTVHIVDLLAEPGPNMILQSFLFGTATQRTNTDVVFDNAGNLYIANRTGEYVRTWSPPSDTSLGYVANQFTTNSLAPLGSIALSSAVGIDGDHNGDNVVDYRDYVVWRADPANNGGDDGYTEWAANYGEGGDGSGAGSAVPEPMSAILVVMGLFTLGASRRIRS